MNKDTRMEQVFTGTYWEAGIVKNLLENANIKVYQYNETIGETSPWASSPSGSELIRVLVLPSDSEKAHEIVNTYTSVCL